MDGLLAAYVREGFIANFVLWQLSLASATLRAVAAPNV